MIILKLLALGYFVAVFVVASGYVIGQYERARDLDLNVPEAHVGLAALVAPILIEAGAAYLTWLMWPLKFLEGAFAVHPVSDGRLPIILVHGYMGHSANLLFLRSRLIGMGFANVALYSYSTTTGGLEEMARELGRRVDRVKVETGAERVDLVGHSLGGLVAQYYVARLDGAPSVRTVIALGSPLAGTRLVPFFPPHAFRLFHPKAEHLRQLREAVRKVEGTRFASVYSIDDNEVIPGAAGALEGFGTNHALSGMGHNALLFSGRVAEIVRSELQPV